MCRYESGRPLQNIVLKRVFVISSKDGWAAKYEETDIGPVKSMLTNRMAFRIYPA